MTTRLLVLAAVATLLQATPAAAAIAELSASNELVYTAATGERNDVALRVLNENGFMSTYEVSDSGALLMPGERCTAVDPHTVRCQAPPAVPGTAAMSNQYIVRLGDGDDRVVVDDAGTGFRGLLANGGTGNDELVGGGAEDVVDGGAGSDVMRGGPGTDTVSYMTRSKPVVVVLAGRDGQGEPGEGDTVSEIENAIGGIGDDRLVGDPGANQLTGGFGRDRLIGRGGDDTLTAGGARTSCGEGHDKVVSPQLGPFGSELVDHLERDCEQVGLFLQIPALAAQPRVLRGNRIGLRISCPSEGMGQPCTARLRIFSAKQRLLAAARLGRGRWSQRLVRLRLTERGRRRLASSSDRAVRIEVRVGQTVNRWTAHLNRPG